MKYIMKEKWVAFGDDFAINDESGRLAYYVDGKVFALGDKLSFQDAQKREIAFIRQRLLSWGKTYEILQNDEIIATVKKKKFTLFRAQFSVDVPGPDDLQAQGSFLDHEYTFNLHGRPVAQVSKKWIALTDSYVINIEPGQNDVLILASAVVIDLCCHAGDND